jgi:hypothetical protein
LIQQNRNIPFLFFFKPERPIKPKNKNGFDRKMKRRRSFFVLDFEEKRCFNSIIKIIEKPKQPPQTASFMSEASERRRLRFVPIKTTKTVDGNFNFHSRKNVRPASINNRRIQIKSEKIGNKNGAQM